jgi:hypothetical protein
MAQFDVFLQLLIFCSGLVGFVAACPPPLNDFYYLGNDTHTTADLIRGLVDQQSPGDSEGWSEIISKVRICLAVPMSLMNTNCMFRPASHVLLGLVVISRTASANHWIGGSTLTTFMKPGTCGLSEWMNLDRRVATN